MKASLRWYSNLAISSPTQLGMSGIATWITYFRRMAKCCRQTDRQTDSERETDRVRVLDRKTGVRGQR